MGGGGTALAEAGRLAASHQVDEPRKGPEVFLHGALAVRARETLSAREGEANFPTLRKGKSEARSWPCGRAAGTPPFRGRASFCDIFTRTLGTSRSTQFQGTDRGVQGVLDFFKRKPKMPAEAKARLRVIADECFGALGAINRDTLTVANKSISLRGQRRCFSGFNDRLIPFFPDCIGDNLAPTY
jgi:hypothetical protein